MVQLHSATETTPKSLFLVCENGMPVIIIIRHCFLAGASESYPVKRRQIRCRIAKTIETTFLFFFRDFLTQ